MANVGITRTIFFGHETRLLLIDAFLLFEHLFSLANLTKNCL